jgi:lipoate-protein ligase A
MSSSEPEVFLRLESGAGAAAWNMAVDELLLESAAQRGRAVLRLYGWTERAATFGYFQRIADIERVTRLRPLIRRPTGGGLVPHDADWTYSLAFPPAHSWYELRAEASYERVHQWLQSGFARLGVPTALAPEPRKEIQGQCFVGYERHDLLWQGRKVAGAAQRRTRAGLLIQGSVQPPPIGLERKHWERAWCEAATEAWNTPWEGWSLPDLGLERARQLTAEKYSQASYNRRR